MGHPKYNQQDEKWNGEVVDKEYAAFRMRNEPLVEVTQVKGTSETHPLLSPNDEWANFEIFPSRIGQNIYSIPYGGYVRDAYLRGMLAEWEGKGNPYKFGLVGASDTHTAALIAGPNASGSGKEITIPSG